MGMDAPSDGPGYPLAWYPGPDGSTTRERGWWEPSSCGHFQPRTTEQPTLPAAQRAEYLARLEGNQKRSPVEDAAARLFVDGLDIRTITWMQEGQINRAKGTVAGKPVSAGTLASLESLMAARPAGASALLFATGGKVPTKALMLATILGTIAVPQPSPIDPDADPGKLPPVKPLPCSYQDESTLAASKGSAIDPTWIGLSVNCVAIQQAVDVLIESNVLLRKGSFDLESTTFKYVIEADGGRLTLSFDLPGKNDTRPLFTVPNLLVTITSHQKSAKYHVSVQIPMEPVKYDPGCIPDDAVTAVTVSRNCLMDMTGGKFTDAQYLQELMYRYFVFLAPKTDSVVVTATLLDGESGGPIDKSRDANLKQVAQEMWTNAFALPVMFDPYYALSPAIQGFEAKDGWLNVYETYPLSPG